MIKAGFESSSFGACTLSSGMSFALCTFKSISKLPELAKTPFALKESGKLPRHLPEITTGPSDERSGI